MKRFGYTIVAISVNAALLTSFDISAEEEKQEEKGLETITVTAQKRIQTVKEVPATVSAISAENLNDYLGAGENIKALAGRVPSLQIESTNGRQSPRFYIRGLGNTDFDVNASQPVSMVLDEIALENPVLKGIPLFDVERVEVLNGPQGTLFGRNTPAGIVKIDTVAPEYSNDGYAHFGFGNRGTLFAETAINAELSGTVAARLSVKHQERDAWVKNVIRDEKVGGYEELAFRLQFLYDNGAGTEALLKLHGFEQEGDMPSIFYANAIEIGKAGLRKGFDEAVIYHDSPSGFEMTHRGGSFKFSHDFNELTLVAVTGYDTLESWSFADIDGGYTDVNAQQNELGKYFRNAASGDGLDDHYQFSQEIRLSGQTDKLFYQGGLYYFREDYTVNNKDLTSEGETLNFYQIDQLTTSKAIFGQVEYKSSEQLAITLGLRYTSDDKELDIRPNGGSDISFEIDKDDSYVNWDLSARYIFNDEWTGFARIGNASRGPVTLGRFGFPSEAETETLTSYEVGLKGDVWDGDARWHITAYTYDIKDHQLVATGIDGNTNALLNADNTFGAGVETMFEAMLTDDLRLNLNLSYNKTEIQQETLKSERCALDPMSFAYCNATDPIVETVQGDFGPVTTVFIDGNPLPRAPKWLGNIHLNYEIPVDTGVINLQTDWTYRSESNFFLYEAVEYVIESRWLGGVRISYQNNDDWELALVGRNITDKIVVENVVAFLNQTAAVNEPRFWGIEGRFMF
ncbi:TonB-dependent receptor [Thalassotalea ganghwensis]